MEFVELPHLSIGSPSDVATMGVSQIDIRNLFEATCPVKARGKLIRKCFIMHKSVRSRRFYGAFIQVFCIEMATVDTRDLSVHEGKTILVVFWTIPCPNFKLLTMGEQNLSICASLVCRRDIPGCRAAERAIEVILGHLQQRQ